MRAGSLPYVAASDYDRADFERRLRETQRLVFRVAYSVLLNAADAEEVTQDVFLRAYRKLSSLRDPKKFRPWVMRISWRLALNRLRASERARRRETLWNETAASPPDSVETLAAAQEFHRRLRNEINRLPEKLRAVLLLSAVEGFDARAVAAILEIPEATVRTRLYHARKQLLRRFSR